MIKELFSIKQKLEQAKNEKTLSHYIPFSSLVAPGIVITREGDLVATWKVEGVLFETATAQQLNVDANSLNAALRILPGSNYAVMIHRTRRVTTDVLSVPQHCAFTRMLCEHYNDSQQRQPMIISGLYVSIIYKTPYRVGKLEQSVEQSKLVLAKRVEEFTTACSLFESALSRFSPRRLAEATVNGVTYSHQLSFYNYLITGIVQPISLPEGPIYKKLGNADIFVRGNVIEIQTSDPEPTYVQMVEIKDFSNYTRPGIFDSLYIPRDVPPYEFIEAQTFCPMEKGKAKSVLTLQRKRLAGSKDESVSQIAALDVAIDDLINDKFVLGEYSYALAVFGRSLDEVQANSGDAMTKLNEEGYTCVTGNLAAAPGLLSMLPGNFMWRPRVAQLSSLNFVHEAPLHSFPHGKREHNPWGEAVTMLRSISDEPFYFNFHATKTNEMSEGKTALGHTLVLGQSGAGKTVTVNFLLAQALKYLDRGRLSIIFFDKDQGAMPFIRACKGTYLSLKTGAPTGFNPFQMPNTAENRAFLTSLLKLLIEGDGRKISAYDVEQLSRAVSTVMNFPIEMRSINLISQNLNEGDTKEERENSLCTYLQRWSDGGDLSWVFNNPKDELNLDESPCIGIDGTDLLKDQDVLGPISFYLLHRVRAIADGRMIIQVMDEFWQWLQAPVFGNFAKDLLKTGRKNNIVCLFATQSPSDVIQSEIARAIIEQCPTQILLPNNNADESEYSEYLKTTPAEFANIRELSPNSRCFIVKQGSTSVMCRLNLAGFDDELDILSGTAENVNLINRLMSNLGSEDPDVWLEPFFQIKRQQRQEARKAKRAAQQAQKAG